MVECRVLGPVEVLSDGEPAPAELKWRKNVALLVYLARSGGKPRSREHLVGLLWPEKPEAAARHSLREALRSIKKNLGDGGLDTDGDAVRMPAGAVRVDTEDFDELVGKGDPAATWQLVRGEFMEGFSVPDSSGFEDWLLAERYAWRRNSIEVAARLAEELVQSGDESAAIGVLHPALALAPDSEELGRLMMRCQALGGDRAGAIKTYELLRLRLTGLGAEPDNDTDLLYQSILREKDWRVPTGDRPAESPRESRRMPLIGRKGALADLMELWGDCSGSGKTAVALISGVPGAGKTRLAQEVVSRIRLGGALIASIRAVPGDRNEPWSGVLGLARGGLTEASGLSGADPEVLGAFARVLPEWRDRFGNTASDVSLARALVEVLRAVSEEQPVAILVDDAQWLDEESLATLESLSRDLEGRPVMMVLTLNENFTTPALDGMRARMGRDLNGLTLKLAPLNLDETIQLAARVLPGYDRDQLERLARRLEEDTAGLPLLAVELLHAIALGLDLERFASAWPAPFQTLEQTMPGDLPDAVVGAIRVGFRKLGEDAQEAVVAAAVIGERASVGDLARATGLDQKALGIALDEAEWQRWLVAEPRGYSFVARIVREVVISDLVTPGKQQRILAQLGS